MEILNNDRLEEEKFWINVSWQLSMPLTLVLG